MSEEPEFFEANDALRESKAMWLVIARAARDAAASIGDWCEDPKNVALAMEWAAQAEACFFRAAGDESSMTIDAWVPAIRRGMELAKEQSDAP